MAAAETWVSACNYCDTQQVNFGLEIPKPAAWLWPFSLL